MFNSYDVEFANFDATAPEKVQIFEIGMPDADDAAIIENLPYLISALSAEEGILRFRTNFTDKPVVQIFFNKEKLFPEKILNILLADTLSYFVNETTTERMGNIFKFEGRGKVIN